MKSSQLLIFFLFLSITCPVSTFATLELGSLKASPYLVKSITLEDKKAVPVAFGKSAQLIAHTYPEKQNVTWSWKPKGDSLATVTINSSGLLTPDENSESGWVIVRAAIAGGQFKEAHVSIGCLDCNGDQCELVPGNGFVQLGSIDVRLSLGKAEEGMSAGDLILQSDQPLAILSSPEALQLSTLSEEVVALYEQGMLRQVITPSTFVTIDRLTPFEYEIYFYRIQDKGALQDGFYERDPEALPISAWHVKNPQQSHVSFNELDITEFRNGKENLFKYSFDDTKDIWNLSSGNGLKFESQKQTINDSGDRIVIKTISGADGKSVSVIEKTFKTFSWGEELFWEIQDPDGDRLTTIINYYENKGPGFSKIRSKIFPDGSWIRYEYDKKGRIIREARPYLDTNSTSPDEQIRLIIKDYTPTDESDSNLERDNQKPRVITETIKGIVVAKSFYLYKTTGKGERTIISEQCAQQDCRFGDKTNLRSLTITHQESSKNPQSGKIKQRVAANGQMTSYFYENGTLEPSPEPGKSVFTPGKGKAIRTTVIQGTEKHPDGIPSQTTKSTSITDWLGNDVMDEIFVKTDSGYERIDWTFRSYNKLGRLIETLHANWTRSENSWSCCGTSASTDIYGITTRTAYDALKQKVAETNEASGIVTMFEYDAAGRLLGNTVSNRELSRSRKTVYDLSGRVMQTVNQMGLITDYYTDTDGLTSKRIGPGGITEITTNYHDGRLRSVTGTGVVDRYYEYGINLDGTQWTKVFVGQKGSSRWEQTSRDFLGRVTRVEKPGFRNIESSKNVYNSINQLIRTISPGQADILYKYDELGNQVETGLDIDGNSQLDLASKDRIQKNQNHYIKIDNIWWTRKSGSVLDQENSDNENTVSTNLNRLTGWDGKIISETISKNLHGNKTIFTEFLDRHNRTRILKTQYPDSNISAVQTFVNNRLITTRNKTGVEQVFGYDNLGRHVSVADKRIGTSVTNYNNKGQVDYIEDAAGTKTGFTYDPETGQMVARINALNKITRFAYNRRGQLIHTWGDVPYPVEYLFNNFGEKVSMRTFRGADNWQQEEWPEKTGPYDETHWQYQKSSGLLLSKTDAKGNSVNYSYTAGGRLQTRTWARGITTTYNYYPGTGELESFDYSDNTPDISFQYDRLGRKVRIIDGVGVHSFTYNSNMQLENEEITGKLNSYLNRKYDDLGRNSGFNMEQEYSVDYHYDSVGRFDSIDWNITGKTGNVDYRYLKNSDLVSGFSFNKNTSVTYEYEPQRNLRTAITNRAQNILLSRYEYQYDRLGRRSNVINSGSAFTKSGFNLYAYNDRNELQTSSSFGGNNLSDQSRPFTEQDRFYQYDPIGNRTQVQETNEKISYTSNELNQYTRVNKKQSFQLDFDVDGNLTELKKDSDTNSYTYNGENRLIAVEPQIASEGDTKSEYVYDYQGRRRIKKVSTYKAGKWQKDAENHFLYDGWNLITEQDKKNQLKASYIHGLDLSQSLQGAGGIGGLLAQIDHSAKKVHYYFYDGNGNVGQLINADTSAITAHYEYDPYGNLITATGSYAAENPFRFSTKYHDDETGLVYYGYRYYVPELGRWLNRDPIGERGGINVYGFVLNDSINMLDAYGNQGFPSGFGTYFDPLEYISHGLYDYWNSIGYKTYTGTVSSWLNVVMQGIASELGPTGSSISYTWVSPPLFLGSVSLNFKVKAAGKCEKCCDVKTSKLAYQFNGSIKVIGSGGVGIGSDAGLGIDVTSTSSGNSDVPNCSSTIAKIDYSLAVVGFAGISSGDWKSTSASFEQPIAECSASLDCRWKFKEGPSFSFGGGAVGARLALAVDGSATGTYWPDSK